MIRTDRISLRCTPQTVQQANELAKLWGPVKALSLADVVAECVARVHRTEAASRSAETTHRTRSRRTDR